MALGDTQRILDMADAGSAPAAIADALNLPVETVARLIELRPHLEMLDAVRTLIGQIEHNPPRAPTAGEGTARGGDG